MAPERVNLPVPVLVRPMLPTIVPLKRPAV